VALWKEQRVHGAKTGFRPGEESGAEVAAVSWWLLGGELPIVVGGALLLVWGA
jgi:hypothetical protein